MTRVTRRPTWGGVTIAVAVAAAVMALAVAPADAVQGQAQRLMYVHVPSAWTAFLAFGVVGVASAAVLLGVGRRWDAVAHAAAELGVAMTALAIAEGSVWGHSAWGVWWTWDPRLVTTSLMLVLYVAYLALRSLPGEPGRVRRRAAVLGVVALGIVPVVHFSVLWWRTLHQPPTLLRPDLAPPIASSMLVTLLLAVVAFMLAGGWWVRRRVAQLSAVPSSAADAATTRRRAADVAGSAS